MIRTTAAGLLLAFALFAQAAANAQQSEQESQSDIVVTGVRPEQVQAFVEQVSAAPPSVDQLARWDDDICVTLAGLPAQQGQILVDQISYRAQAVGLSPGGAGCQPNVFVFFAADGNAFARDLVAERQPLFAYYHEENVATLGREALTSFVETPRPVRWWHVAQTRGADGDRLGSDSAHSSAPPPPQPTANGEIRADSDGFRGIQVVRSQGTRTRAVERQDFNRVIIVVDGAQISGIPIESIADYLAMVALAQIDPQAETRDYPTILNLFSDDPDDVSFVMTNWDTAYLSGLYASTRNAASVTQQLHDISRRMQGGDRTGE